MQFNTLQSLLVILTAGLVLAKDCSGVAGGLANGECVQYYGGGDCKGLPIGSYVPTCGGESSERNCFKYDSFSSLYVTGDGTYGTNCIAYADDNCQQEMTETGNVVVGPGSCTNVPEAKSMQCFYRC
ncbi:hypothetical protein AURDEDRAFT_156599 [Auricularia subglabra TFB-10046 SS5]|nr:hypothetical protein AURDEDRAFT_156599 [Auricularia subglabra TFB-10046 SS5]